MPTMTAAAAAACKLHIRRITPPTHLNPCSSPPDISFCAPMRWKEVYRLGLGPWEVSATPTMRIGLSALFHTHKAHPRGTARASPLLRRLAGSKKCMGGTKFKDEGEFRDVSIESQQVPSGFTRPSYMWGLSKGIAPLEERDELGPGRMSKEKGNDMSVAYLNNSCQMQGRLSAWLATHGLPHQPLGFDYQEVEIVEGVMKAAL